MGSRIDASMVDKWELYEIARYCDESVSDGAGGTEPRFTCNVFIQSQQDAYTVLNDLAAVFRGITFWGNEQIFIKADVPQEDVDWVYTASNVINGEFSYAGGSYKNVIPPAWFPGRILLTTTATPLKGCMTPPWLSVTR